MNILVRFKLQFFIEKWRQRAILTSTALAFLSSFYVNYSIATCATELNKSNIMINNHPRNITSCVTLIECLSTVSLHVASNALPPKHSLDAITTRWRKLCHCCCGVCPIVHLNLTIDGPEPLLIWTGQIYARTMWVWHFTALSF